MIDHWVWLAWLATFGHCMQGPGEVHLDAAAECCWSDMDRDGDIDLHDWWVMLSGIRQTTSCVEVK